METLTINNFGELMKQSTANAINYKKLLINSILTERHGMGHDNTGEFYDKLSDMDIDELELFNIEYKHLNKRK